MLQFLSTLAPLIKQLPQAAGQIGQIGGMLAGAGQAPIGAPGGMLAAQPPAAPAALATQAIQAVTPQPEAGGFLSRFMSPSTGRQLMDAGSAMMQAGAPSLDPASGDFLGSLGKGFQAYGQSGRAYRDDEVKQAYTQAMIGNTNANADSSRASAELARRQADAAAEGMPLYAGAGAAAMAAPAAVGQAILPQAGTLVDGYRFKGGNPNDPANWEVAS